MAGIWLICGWVLGRWVFCGRLLWLGLLSGFRGCLWLGVGFGCAASDES
jgi:hypothetical protein